jgi:hypothetical protein
MESPFVLDYPTNFSELSYKFVKFQIVFKG